MRLVISGVRLSPRSLLLLNRKMAIFLPGPILSDVRGSIAGTTFSKSAAGNTAKARRGPVQLYSSARGVQRNTFMAVSKAWTVFTVVDQQAWRTFAAANPVPNRFGLPQVLSGMAMYQYLNAIPRRFATGTIGLPPADLSVSEVESFSLTCKTDPSGFVKVEIISGGSTINDRGVVYVSGPVGRGRTTPPAGFYMVPVVVALNTVVDITAEWVVRFGSLPQGIGNTCIADAMIFRVTNGARSPRVRSVARFT